MSVQKDASEAHRLLCEWIWAGAIGAVSEVHIWSNRPIWPQGLERPNDTPPVPRHLDWDLWLGPAPERPYHPAYHPFKFRGWWDFGTGALGDMGCHGLNPIFKALRLGHPLTVQADSTKLFPETAPKASTVHYEFPARGDLPSVALTWYDGGRKPEKPAGLENTRLGANYGGILFIGSDGMIACDGLGGSPRLVPEEKMQAFRRPPKALPRSVGHYKEWIAACKGGPPAGCHFGVGGPLTEVVLLGNVAIRTRQKLTWNPEKLECTGSPGATRLLREPYRAGWAVDALGR
jgi:predicted dehydrogenase